MRVKKIIEDSNPNKFTGAVTILETPCHSCKHYNKDLTCKAFPNRIPIEILRGKHDHRTPFKGDNGVQYEPKD